MDPRLDRSGGGPVIVVQYAAQALPALDLSRASEVAGFWTDELVPQSLMIALSAASPRRRQDSLMLCTNLSA